MSQMLPLIEQLKQLEQLQVLDLKIDSLKKTQHMLPQPLKLLQGSWEKLTATLELKHQQIAESEKNYRQEVAAAQLNQERSLRAQSKMESVKNTQEFQAATKELEQLKKLNVTLEEQHQKTGEVLSGLQNEVVGLEEELENLKNQKEEQQVIIAGKNHAYQQEMDELFKQRAVFCEQVEKRILSQYDRVRSARGGVGLITVEMGRCKGCNMMVPPQLYNEVKRGLTLHVCPSCHRILVGVAEPSEIKS